MKVADDKQELKTISRRGAEKNGEMFLKLNTTRSKKQGGTIEIMMGSLALLERLGEADYCCVALSEPHRTAVTHLPESILEEYFVSNTSAAFEWRVAADTGKILRVNTHALGISKLQNLPTYVRRMG